MEKQPLVSIIIPTYNRAHLIKETLDSIIAQTYKNWECIVVDDGSSDDTDSIMRTYCEKDSRIQYHHRPEEHLPGGNGARNYGFKLSKGEYVQWFDSDDLMNSLNIETHLHIILKNEKNISIGLLNRYNEDYSVLTKEGVPHQIKNSIYYDFILRIFKAHLPTTFFSKSILKDYKFDEKLKKSQEVEFLQRIFRENEEEIIYFNEILIKVRRHKESITGKFNDIILKDKLKVKIILFKELPEKTPNIVKKALLYNYLKVLKPAFKHKRCKIFFKYLFKLPIPSMIIIKLIGLYFVYFITNRGDNLYQTIIKINLDAENIIS